MDLVVDEGKKPLEKTLSHSLLPLFLHCHDENQRVAQASRETLLRVTEFLKRRKLKQLVKKEQLLKFAKCLLAEDRSRAAEHLRRALPYLQNPQEPLRAAAIRFLGEPRARAPSPARRSSAPAPPAAPAAASGPGAVEPRLPSGLLPPSRSRARPWAAGSGRARAEPCRGRRPCGRSAGSAAGTELCRWRRDTLCVRRDGRGALMAQKEELQALSEGVQAPRNSASPFCSSIENCTHLALRAKEVGLSSGSTEPLSQEQYLYYHLPVLLELQAQLMIGTAEPVGSSHGFNPLFSCS
ncbi:uncharacterized protein LOC134562368 isoform X1 [Prinia subflava]|uniref:uncharacterized protein LOC134562368 isoform X1 n=1 Tax=Prinia subflava TaxID=208062 RepID=UPI002FE126FF